MTFKSKILGAAALSASVLMSGQALALSEVNVDGVVLPTGTQGHAIGQAAALVDGVNIGDAMSFDNATVIGQVGAIYRAQDSVFGSGLANFGAQTWSSGDNGVELTYEIDLEVAGIQVNQAPTPMSLEFEVEVTLGLGTEITYRVDAAQNFDQSNAATATDGDIWVTATLAQMATLVISEDQIVTLGGEGLFFAVDPLTSAGDNLDTNLGPNGSDVVTFSILLDGGGAGVDALGNLSGLYSGATNTEFQAISEPATLGLLGLGLVGMGLVGRRRA
jgi:hypothetical protein